MSLRGASRSRLLRRHNIHLCRPKICSRIYPTDNHRVSPIELELSLGSVSLAKIASCTTREGAAPVYTHHSNTHLRFFRKGTFATKRRMSVR